MTEELIRQVKNIQRALVNRELFGEDLEEKEAVIRKLEEVNEYLKDALARKIEF